MADDAQQPINLTNHFLIAMPGMEDGTFTRSVIYVCEHSERGALGLIINKPGDISLADLFERVDLPLERPELGGQPVFHGGPLQTERGFVLHEPIVAEGLKPDESIYASTLTVPGGLEMTTSKDVGYSSWGEGQLESEIAGNSWLTVDADADVIFDAPVDQRYDRALGLLGLQAWMLSPDVGHA